MVAGPRYAWGVSVVDALNANSGAIVAISATVSAVITILLLLEARTTRNLRRIADVVAYPTAHGAAGMYLELVALNGGPTNARDVKIAFRFTGPDGTIEGAPRTQVDPLLAPGHNRRFLASPSEGLATLNEYADRGLTLEVDWSWTDDRRRFWFLPRRHQRFAEWAAADLRAGLYGGWALTERDRDDDIHKIADAARDIEKHMKVVAREQAKRVARPEVVAAAQVPPMSAVPAVPSNSVRSWFRRLRHGC